MDNKNLFLEVFSNFQSDYSGLELRGNLVYYKGVCKFNTEGFCLAYNLLRLTKLLEAAGELN